MSKRHFNPSAVIVALIGFISCLTLILLFIYNRISNDLIISAFLLALLLLGLASLIIAFWAKKNRSAILENGYYDRRAYIDVMTQVRNRAAFHLITEELDPDTYPRLSLIMADLNNLKQVNDTLGHPTGDKLICSLVNYLNKAFGSMGTIYRYGGDEFVILIKDASAEDVQSARALFDKMIADHCAHGGLEIFVALGIASRTDPQNSTLHVKELLFLADNVMYQYKAAQKAARSSSAQPPRQRPEQIDAATGILTFSSFKRRVQELLSSDDADNLCLINFDLNFSYDHSYLFRWDSESRLLQRLTSLALNLCSESGFCAHAEADSFWILSDYPDMESLTDRITAETRQFQQQLGDFPLFPSFGIYPISDRTIPVADMCNRARAAKHDIKGRLDILYNIYGPEHYLHRARTLRLTSYIQYGLNSSEFVPYFQPKYSIDGNSVVGAEALTRWIQTNNSCLLPDEFMALYESSGLILSLDWHILKQVCIFLREQLSAGTECVPISINFSRLHIYETDCAERICRIVDQYELPHNLLGIELTETALIQDIDSIHHLISSIHEKGFSVSLDGFGNGLSSLVLLKKLMIDSIKIDPSLIETSEDIEACSSILSSIIDMCRRLNIICVAECVETEEQLALLRRCGCDMVQGRLLAPPMPEKDFIHLLRSQRKNRLRSNLFPNNPPAEE